ncbi:BatA domain-containing protein [Kiritimatiellota bacterium B12222]|nr:BatA domain-containing protein [Kiritimatiellota bacterium B12222]
MAFFNFYMLLGTLAVAIPIIIHILNRKSAKPVKWGAMRFLKDSLVSRRSKILLEEFLLMCLRCLLVLLLALVAARPFVTPGSWLSWFVVLPMMLMATAAIAGSFVLTTFVKWRRRLRVLASVFIVLSGMALIFEETLQARIFRGDGGRDIALMIDASDSMDLVVDGERNFDTAIAESKRVVETAPAGSAFSLVVGGSIPYAPIANPLSDREAVVAALDAIRPSKGTMKVPEALSLAALTLARGNNVAKQVILLGDGQQAGWNLQGQKGEWEAVKESIEGLPGNPSVILRRLALPAQIRNAGISDITFSRELIGLDRPVSIEVTISNYGDQAITPGSVVMRVEGEVYQNEELGQMSPNATQTITFEHQFRSTGAHVLEVELTGQDDLNVDNRDWRIVCPVAHVKVLLVDGNPAPHFMDRASAFAALALAPNTDTENMLVQPKVVSAAEFPRLTNYHEYAVIMLLDVPRLPQDAAERLSKFVIAGGGLLVAHGPQSEANFYNQWGINSYPVMPATLGQHLYLGTDLSQNLGLATATLDHPSLEMLRDQSMDLSQVIFRSYWKLVFPEEGGDLHSKVGFRLNNDDPYLVSHPLGAGQVIQVATGLDSRDSSLPSSRAFVLVLHQLVADLADSGRGDLNTPYQLGASVSISGLVPSTDTARRSQLVLPLNARLSAPLLMDSSGHTEKGRFQLVGDEKSGQQMLLLQVPPVLSPGLLYLTVPEPLVSPLDPWLTEEKTLPLVFTRQGEEGRIVQLTDADSERIRKYVLWQEAETPEQLMSAVAGARFGRELWRPIALTLFLLLIGEIALTRWIALRRKMGESLNVEFEQLNQPRASFLKHLDIFKKG